MERRSLTIFLVKNTYVVDQTVDVREIRGSDGDHKFNHTQAIL